MADTSPLTPEGYMRPYSGAAAVPVLPDARPKSMPPVERSQLPLVPGVTPCGWARVPTDAEVAWSTAAAL